MKVRACLLIALCVAASCTGRDARPADRGPTRSPDVGRKQLGFRAVGFPPPAGSRCPAPPREAGGYTVLMGPTSGKAGTPVTMGGYTPLFNEAHHYVGPSGRIGFWFNLPLSAWPRLYSAQRPPRSSGGVAVIHLGEADVAGQCSYRVMFKVPAVPPGVYLVVPIEHGRGSSSAFEALEFHVTTYGARRGRTTAAISGRAAARRLAAHPPRLNRSCRPARRRREVLEGRLRHRRVPAAVG
jgi:hypothetical protein